VSVREKLELWFFGYGVDKAGFELALQDERMAWELKQTPVDPVGLMRSLPYDVCPKDAREQLEFLVAFRAN